MRPSSLRQRHVLTVVAIVIATLWVPTVSRAVADPDPVRVHATVATSFGGTRQYDISAAPGPTGTVVITEPVGSQRYPGTVTCFRVDGADAVVGAMVLQESASFGLTYGVVVRIHDAGPGGDGDTIAEETPWTTGLEPDCDAPAEADPWPVVAGYAAVGSTSDGGPGSVQGAGTIDFGDGLSRSFEISAERDPSGSVSGRLAMTSTAEGSFVGTIDCVAVFGDRAVIGVTLAQVPEPAHPTVYHLTLFLIDGEPDTAAFNAMSATLDADCAAAAETPPSPITLGGIIVSSGPLPSETPPPTPEPTPDPTRAEPTAGPPLPPAIGFVSANGRELRIGGRPWRFTGMNVYNAASDGWCSFAFSDATLAEALDAIGLGGTEQGVIRTWFFQPQAIDKATRSRSWERLDRVLRIAAEKGYRVIPTLTDHWGECGSDAPNGVKDLAWYSGGYALTDPGMLTSYRSWVTEVVGRYRDDPTIVAWQIINEAEVLPSSGCPADASMAIVLKDFARDISDLIRSIDPNHLISFGTIGGGQCGAVMTQWQELHDLPNVDLCEVHDYSGAGAPAIYGDVWNGLQRRIEQCAALDKPIFVGEVGVTAAVGLEPRAQEFLRKLAHQANSGIVGHLAWGWRTTESYAIQPSDPVLEVLARGPYRVVTSPTDIDDGSCDALSGCGLREAMDAANAGLDNGSIRFDLPAGSGPIQPAVVLPGFEEPVIVDGRPLPGDPDPWPPVLDGALVGPGGWGISIKDRVTIQGLEIRNFPGPAIVVMGADNRIGGPTAGDGNRLLANGGDGVLVEDRETAQRNTILGNAIADNGRLAINLGGHEPTLMSVGSAVGGSAGGTGPNERPPQPMMLPARPGDLTAAGSYLGYSGRDYRIEVFWSPSCRLLRPDAAVLLGAFDLTMPGGSTPPIPFEIAIPGALQTGYLTATATDHLGNTSEVGACAPVVEPFDVRLAAIHVAPSAVAVGRTTTIAAIARNDGPAAAIGMVVALGWPTDAFEVTAGPSGGDCDLLTSDDSTYALCRPPIVAPGADVSVEVTVRARVAGVHAIEAIATLLVDGGDLDGSNDTAGATVSVIPATTTPTGTSVSATPTDPVTGTTPVDLTFADVTSPGATTLVLSAVGPTVPSGLKLGDPPIYYDIETTAMTVGPITVCVRYDAAAFADEGAIRLLHFDPASQAWQDVTTSHDAEGDRICGMTDSLSPFALVERSFAFDGFFSPVDDPPILNRTKAGSAVPVKFTLGGDHGYDVFADGSPAARAIPCPTAPSDLVESTTSSASTELSYDPVSDRYTWTWKTSKAWANSCRELTLSFSDGSFARALFHFVK